MSAAASGALATPEGRRAQAERLLGTARGQAGVRSFILDWLGTRSFERVSKDDAAFTPELAASMLEEPRRFLDDVLWQGDARLGTLLTAPAPS